MTNIPVKEEYIHVKTENFVNSDERLEEEGNDSEEDEDLRSVSSTPKKSTKIQGIGNVGNRTDYIFPSTKNPIICIAEENLHKNIWDIKSWNKVIDEARIMKIEDARQIYERALEQFPTSGKIWRYYAEHEFKTKNYDKVEIILSKSLYQCPNVNIWEFYIDYVRDINLDSFERVPMDERKRKLDTVKEACETAINNIGFHINSNNIWKKYIEIKKKYREISYLGIANVNNDIREAYQRALCIPMNELDIIWKDYTNFEKDKGYERYIKEQEAKKSKSLEIYNKKKEIWQRILNDELATPPTGTEDERKQLICWKKALEYDNSIIIIINRFDKTNPRKLAKEEHRFHMRILYMECLCIMRFHEDIWYDFAMFENSFDDIVSSKQIFEQASTILTDSLIIQFAYCDFLESRGLKDETKALYERLLTRKHSNEHQTLIYIIYQKFLLRNEGLMASRNLFSRARNDPKCDYRIYEASADIELYYNHNSSISRKIYQVCYDKYKTNTSFLSDYIDFLESIGDTTNMKALYDNIFNNQEIKISDQLKLRYLSHLLISEDKTKNLGQLMKNQCKLDCLDENLYSDSLCYCNRFTNGLHACNVIDQSLEERYCDLFNLKYDRKSLRMMDEEKKRIKKERKESNKEFENDPNLPNFVKSWLRVLPMGSQSRTPDSTIDLVLDFLSMELPPQPND